MIVIRMSGGLGNQMFQYALYLQLCALGRDVAFDDWTEYERQEETGVKRPIGLSVFGIDYPRADRETVVRLTDADGGLAAKVRRKVRGRRSLEKHDSDLVFDPSFLRETEGYFCGCFQSERYFAGAEGKVREAFAFPADLFAGMPEREALAAKISGADDSVSSRNAQKCGAAAGESAPVREAARGEESVAVHLRFGDYLDKAQTYGGICTPQYYGAAVRLMEEQIAARGGRAHFYVFSNDPDKAGEWIGQLQRRQSRAVPDPDPISGSGQETGDREVAPLFTLVEGADEAHGYLDLALMARCRHHIIANSSFSWWGAWLGRREGQILIAPSLWIHMPDGSDLARTDIFTENMIRISAAGEICRVPQSGFAAVVCGTETAAERETTVECDTVRKHGTMRRGQTEAAVLRETAPLVSVIVAAYNVADYLPRAFDSLSRQTWRNLELIVVDDGSTDGRTPQLCDAFAARDLRVRVIHKENGGLSDARNAGLAAAQGAYIAFLDGDDWYEPQMIEATVRACLMVDADVAVIRYRQVTEGGDPLQEGETPGSDLREKEISGSSQREENRAAGGVSGGRSALIDGILRQSVLLDQLWALRVYVSGDPDIIIYNSVWSKLFKREVIDGLTFPVGRNSEDIVFTGKAFTAMRRLVYLDVPLYNYVLNRTGSIMNERLGERRFRDELPFWREQAAHFEAAGFPEIAKRAAYSFYRRMLWYDLEFREKEELGPYAERLEQEILAEKEKILPLLREPFASRGDSARIRLFLLSPSWYALFSDLYEKTVVRLKNAASGRRR